jgi:hypothetical protein
MTSPAASTTSRYAPLQLELEVALEVEVEDEVQVRVTYDITSGIDNLKVRPT